LSVRNVRRIVSYVVVGLWDVAGCYRPESESANAFPLGMKACTLATV